MENNKIVRFLVSIRTELFLICAWGVTEMFFVSEILNLIGNLSAQ